MIFEYDELKDATGSFDDALKIGEGGFGKVFKGNARGTVVAVKVLSEVCNYVTVLRYNFYDVYNFYYAAWYIFNERD